MLWLVAYVGTIFGANYAIGHWGWCSPNGPCLIPVGFGLMAPSGVLFVGLALTLRDLAQDRLGRRPILLAIVAGAALSALLSPALALASGAAFLVSELADFAVYTPLRERGHQVAGVLASNAVGSAIDSALFLWLAFGSLDFILGQVVGKWEMTLLTVAVLWGWRRYAHLARPRAAAV